MLLQAKKLFSNSNEKGLVHSSISAKLRRKSCLGPLYRDDEIYEKINHPRETGFLIFKREISAVKNTSPCRDGIIFTCSKTF